MRPARPIFLRIAIAGAVALLPSTVFGQLPPTYTQFLRDPLPDYQLTPNDLPNLGRLVVLEATSMYIHAREELYDSPAGRQLIGEIADVWIAADAFTAAVSFDPGDARIAEAGMLALPDLLGAYERLRETMQIVPGRAQVTAWNFRGMSRVMAVISPIVREASDELAAAETPLPAPGDPADLRRRSAALSSAIESLSGSLARTPGGSNLPGRLKDRLGLLGRLARGFGSVLAEGPDERDAASSFRPLRSLATGIDQEISKTRPPASIRDGWRNVLTQVDELAEMFQLPREIIVAPPPNQPIPADEASVTAIDQALREMDPMINSSTTVVARQAAPASVADDLRRLRMRLLVLRQQLVGREPSWRIIRSTGDVETARRRLGDRLNQPLGQGGMTAKQLLKDVDEVIARARHHLSGGH
jgi:hypothetical protein